MARTLTEIYESAKETRNQYVEIYEIDNPSKMSIMESYTWNVATCIWSFETILELHKVDIAND